MTRRRLRDRARDTTRGGREIRFDFGDDGRRWIDESDPRVAESDDRAVL
jgi:hypothetical protein